MRIVHVSDCYLPRVGGIELHLRDLAHRQVLDGHDVSIVTRTPDDGRRPSAGVLRVHSVSSHDLSVLAPDVLHAHVSVLSPLALSSAVRAAHLGVPTVVTVHSLWSDLALMAPLVRATTGLTGAPIVWTAVSRTGARQVERVVRAPVMVVPNAVDLDFWSARPPGDAGAHQDRPATVVSVMRLTAVKRTLPLARILRAVSGRCDLSAVIVGDGPRRPALESYLHRHGLSARVRITGTLDRTAVRDVLDQASVFLAPARRESFGIAALEARAAGLPVVAPRDSGVASFVEHGREGLLGVDDRALAEHTAELVQDRPLRAGITAHNRAVPPAYTWDAAVARNHAAYLLAGGGPTVAGTLETAAGR
jgi:glycosyltransferase involved in cell wall biosynthesis